MAKRFSLEGRTVLLTGASSGVGAELAERLLDRDCRVIAWSRRPPEIESDADLVHEAVDLADSAALDAALSGLTTRHPDLSVVINNAGVSERGDFATMAAAELDRLAETQIAVNLAAPIRITQHLFPHLRAQASAMLVNNSSGLAVAPTAMNPVYCATKAGLRSFTYSTRYQAERAGGRLKVVEVLLPLVETPMTASRSHRGKLSADKAATRIIRGMERAEAEIWVGQAAILRRITGFSPALARRLLKIAGG
ncbi:SDR family NAD(P)-dependent oxidoreductase [Aurantimonas sp. VKM B-3413]|uniref:SDR family NAD(P)-dependent oxidoreductase n=1 Tax=Aurantimonas sp. VKM B-3413 TaxID=2779401 RepID=UPI001E3E3F8C|nr:SDR family NAD(P)-dependent oxidoreductase [Aurantimonas sp. VKM B-3413]MCB8839727.1 SDR family NAD(P)-dependent oxidoreductase [Aurantimonas sp. VKM B-3413]